MVNEKYDYIQHISTEDLDKLEWNEGLEIITNDKTYRISKKETITLDVESIRFLHCNSVVELKYGQIRDIYKVKESLEFSEVMFILGLCVLFIAIMLMFISG